MKGITLSSDVRLPIPAANYEPDGGGFNNALSRLRTLGLIEGRRELELAQDLRK
jgi:hypothetical protein